MYDDLLWYLINLIFKKKLNKNINDNVSHIFTVLAKIYKIIFIMSKTKKKFNK